MTSDGEIQSQIEGLQGELRTFRKAHRLFREQVRAAIIEDIHRQRVELGNLCLTIAADGGLAGGQDINRLAALLALTDDRALETRLRGLDHAPDVGFSELTVTQYETRIADFETKIGELQAELRDRERGRAHEAVDREFV